MKSPKSKVEVQSLFPGAFVIETAESEARLAKQTLDFGLGPSTLHGPVDTSILPA